MLGDQCVLAAAPFNCRYCYFEPFRYVAFEPIRALIVQKLRNILEDSNVCQAVCWTH